MLHRSSRINQSYRSEQSTIQSMSGTTFNVTRERKDLFLEELKQITKLAQNYQQISQGMLSQSEGINIQQGQANQFLSQIILLSSRCQKVQQLKSSLIIESNQEDDYESTLQLIKQYGISTSDKTCQIFTRIEQKLREAHQYNFKQNEQNQCLELGKRLAIRNKSYYKLSIFNSQIYLELKKKSKEYLRTKLQQYQKIGKKYENQEKLNSYNARTNTRSKKMLKFGSEIIQGLMKKQMERFQYLINEIRVKVRGKTIASRSNKYPFKQEKNQDSMSVFGLYNQFQVLSKEATKFSQIDCSTTLYKIKLNKIEQTAAFLFQQQRKRRKQSTNNELFNDIDKLKINISQVIQQAREKLIKLSNNGRVNVQTEQRNGDIFTSTHHILGKNSVNLRKSRSQQTFNPCQDDKVSREINLQLKRFFTQTEKLNNLIKKQIHQKQHEELRRNLQNYEQLDKKLDQESVQILNKLSKISKLKKYQEHQYEEINTIKKNIHKARISSIDFIKKARCELNGKTNPFVSSRNKEKWKICKICKTSKQHYCVRVKKDSLVIVDIRNAKSISKGRL